MDEKSRPIEIYIVELDNHASYHEQEDSNENKTEWEDGTIAPQLLNITKTYEIIKFEIPTDY
jgi:hypothetical protein